MKRSHFLYFVIISTILSSMIYLRFAALYHFMIIGSFLYAYRKKNLELKTYMTLNKFPGFLLVWTLFSAFSCLYAPSVSLGLQYTYYILLLFLYSIVFVESTDTREKIFGIVHFFIILNFVASAIGIWEYTTGNHIIKDYLDSPERMRIMKYMPGFTYRNPNDFAFLLMQLFPFVIYGYLYEKKQSYKLISLVGIVMSLCCVMAAESRTILITMLLFLFIMTSKVMINKLFAILLFVIFIAIAIWLSPDLAEFMKNAFEGISKSSIEKTIVTSGASGSTRIALLKNCLLMCLHTAGIGVGAGCHRIKMWTYSSKYFNTGHVLVAHNFLVEVVADYGVVIFIYLIAILVIMQSRMQQIEGNNENGNVRNLAKLMRWEVILFPVGAITSSSLIQMTSLWTVLIFIAALIEVEYKEKKDD